MCDAPIKRYGCVKTPKSQMIDRLVRISSTGFRTGNVTSRNTRQELAPSISAASTSSFGTCDSAAYVEMTTNGSAPQTISDVVTPSCEKVVAYQSCCSIPST